MKTHLDHHSPAFFHTDYWFGINSGWCKSTKMRIKYSMDQGRINAPYSYEVADLTILMIGNDAAVAHYSFRDVGC